MRLLISEWVVGEIVEFSKKYGSKGPIFHEFKISIPLGIFSINFFQPERYSQLISCYFAFQDEVGFFFEDVLAAVVEDVAAHQSIIDACVTNCDDLVRNDAYVRSVLEFCEKNIDVLTSMPPSWYQRAVKISDTATRKNFPDLADEDVLKKQELWQSWRSKS